MAIRISKKLSKRSQHSSVLVALLLLTMLIVPIPVRAAVSVDVSGFNPEVKTIRYSLNVRALTQQSDGKILIGGGFEQINGMERKFIARLNADSSLDIGFNPQVDGGPIKAIAQQDDGKVLIAGYFTDVGGVSRSHIARLNTDGSLDASFDPGSGPDNYVSSITLQDDGKVLIIGDFTEVDGVVRNYIARLNANGSLDTSFNPKVNGEITSVPVRQPGGRVLIAGFFTEVDGVSRNYIARLNADGRLDTSFNPHVGDRPRVMVLLPDGKVLISGSFYVDAVRRYCLTRLHTDGSLDTSFNPETEGTGCSSNNTLFLQMDGKILIDRQFTDTNGATRYGLIRFNADGSLDTSFDTTLSIANGGIYVTMEQYDGKLLIGGDFSTVNDIERIGISRFNLDGNLDAGFTPGTGVTVDGPIRQLGLQPDGKILISGSFNTVNGLRRQGIARLNTDGNIDVSFNPDKGDSEAAFTLQSDGKILIGGSFTQVNGVERIRIARLNADGSLDTSFDPGIGANDQVLALAQQSDGKVLVSGDFTEVGGVSRNHIARLNADGSLDVSFDPGQGPNDSVSILLPQDDGKVLIGGKFNHVNFEYIGSLARLNADGTHDASYNPNIYSWDLNALVQQPDGKVLIGGPFTQVNGVARNYIARLHANGSLDTSFDPGRGANDIVRAMALQPDGKVLIGGSFTQVNGVERIRIARLNADGSLDASFNPGIGANNLVSALAQQSDGKVLIGGSFSHVNGLEQNYIARLDSEGTLDESFNPGTQLYGPVYALAQQTGGKLLIAGDFDSVYGISRNNIARLHDDSNIDTSFFPGAGANDIVFALTIQADDKVLVGGKFTEFSYLPRNRIARLNANGSLDTSFNPGRGANDTVLAMALQPDGKVFIGGAFTTVNDLERNHIARLNADGSLDANFNPNINDQVHSIVQQLDSKVLIGGMFSQINGISYTRIARLNADGSLDTGFDPGAGSNGTVTAIALQADGKILIGGAFTEINSVAKNHIARLNADGSLDTGFDPGAGLNGTVSAIALQADGKILIGGAFTEVEGVESNYFARLNSDGSLDTSFEPDIRVNNSVETLVQKYDGKVLIGGNFTSVNSIVRNHIARLNLDEAAPQTLKVAADGVSLNWLRGGANPLLERTTFEIWDNLSSNWIMLGNGQRTVGGWILNGLNLSIEQVVYLRARGYYGTDSSSRAEFVKQIYVRNSNDDDNDGVDNASDNCPLIYNPDQLDNDQDGLGDICDLDDDNDGVDDASDNCPLIYNPDQLDNDKDGLGDICDLDDDNDGMPDDYEIANGFDPFNAADAYGDADEDSFTNLDEYLAGTVPTDSNDHPIAIFVSNPEGLLLAMKYANNNRNTIQFIRFTANIVLTGEDETGIFIADGKNATPSVIGTVVLDGQGYKLTRDGALACNLDFNEDKGEFRLLHVENRGDLTIRNLSLENGCADGPGNSAYSSRGGAVFNRGTLAVSNSTFHANSSVYEGGGIYNITKIKAIGDSIFSNNLSQSGGGIFSHGEIGSIISSTFSDNKAGDKVGNGGGIASYGDINTIANSTFSGNTAYGGSGIYNNGMYKRNGVSINTIYNCTFSGNTAHQGSGIYNAEKVSIHTIINSTFSGNKSISTGSVITHSSESCVISTISNSTFSGNDGNAINYGFGEVSNLTNTIITGSTHSACSSPYSNSNATNRGSNNLTDGSCPGDIGDVTHFDTILKDNGCVTPGPDGCVKTHALLAGSNAIDAAVHGADSDQRGFDAFNGRDIGAWESADQDSDGLGEADEVAIGTSPYKSDTDDDGLSDKDEISIYGTNPLKADTDGDGYSDGDEVGAGSDPLDPDSYPTPCTLPAGAKDTMLRDTAAKWLGKCVYGATHIPPTYTSVYSDVVYGDYNADWIEQFYNDGFTNGCNLDNTLYCPNEPVTKLQAVKLILRAKHGGSYMPLGASTYLFGDVPFDHPDVDWIYQAKDEGITTGCGDGSNFCPGAVLNQEGFQKMLDGAF